MFPLWLLENEGFNDTGLLWLEASLEAVAIVAVNVLAIVLIATKLLRASEPESVQ